MDWRGHLITVVLAFILGVIVAWKGCESETITKVVERPVPQIKYVDRWKTDTVRFVTKQIVTRTDTIYQNKIVNRLDTLLLIDTIKIVETWLTELAQYDTTIEDVRLRWQNYQNVSENLVIDYLHKKSNTRFALGVHGFVGLQSDFVESYTPLFGVGLQGTVKRTYFSANYGFNGQHYIGVGVGRNIIMK